MIHGEISKTTLGIYIESKDMFTSEKKVGTSAGSM